MRLLAALKTQIEFKKRLARPSENDLVSEGPEGQGVRRGQHPTSLRSPWVGSKRVNRPHCGIVGGSATEMSKLPTRKKTGSWDRTILEGVPELAMPERTPLGSDSPISAPKWRCSSLVLGVEVQSGPGATSPHVWDTCCPGPT